MVEEQILLDCIRPRTHRGHGAVIASSFSGPAETRHHAYRACSEAIGSRASAKIFVGVSVHIEGGVVELWKHSKRPSARPGPVRDESAPPSGPRRRLPLTIFSTCGRRVGKVLPALSAWCRK